MKKFLSLILVLGLGLMLILHLDSNEAFSKFGDEINNRVSQSYIDKNVTEENDEVNYQDRENYETDSANIVTSIIANYRSFDTLGEVTVLFISALGVAMLIGVNKPKRISLDFKPNFILKVGSKALFGIIFMTGVYITIHGHLTPGGGFPGGSMIAASFLVLYIADESYRVKVKNFKYLEGLMGILYVGIGLAGLVLSGYFLENFLDTGYMGQLISAGIIPIVYVLIGLKVGSELASIIDHFLTEEGA